MIRVEKILLKEIMIDKPFTIDVNEDFAVAWDIFRLRDIRHLPVLVNDRLLTGIITLRDLYRVIAPKKTQAGQLIYDVNELNKFVLKDVMVKEVFTLSPENTIGEAIDLMVDKRVGCLPLVDERKYLHGLVTRGDILRTVAKYFM